MGEVLQLHYSSTTVVAVIHKRCRRLATEVYPVVLISDICKLQDNICIQKKNQYQISIVNMVLQYDKEL